MSQSISESLVDDGPADVEIETTADVVKPIVQFGRQLVDEARVHCDDGGLWYSAVDPANVSMVRLTATPDEFEQFHRDGGETAGVELKSLNGALQLARQSKPDPVTLSTFGDRITTIINREYSGTKMGLRNQIRALDPDSIRQEPDIPDMEVPVTATLPFDLYADAVTAIDKQADHIRIQSDDSDLVMGGEGDVNSTTAVVDGVVDEPGDGDSMLSLDYLTDSVTAFDKLDAGEVTIHLGDEMPVVVEATVELFEGETTAEWFQAPRIKEGDRP